MKGSVYQNKRSKRQRWIVSIYWQGKCYKVRKHPVTGEPFSSDEQARKQLSIMRGEIDRGMFNPAHWKTSSPLLMRTYAPDWLNVIDVSPNTLRGYKSAVNNYIVPFLGNKDIRDMLHRDIVQFHKWIDLSGKGKYNVVSTLKTMMYYAYRNEDIPKVPPFPKLSCQAPEIKFLDMEQQQVMLDAIPEEHRPIFIFMMECGCRPGEARALQKDCITENTVIIKRSFSDNTLKETTKSKMIRHVPITDGMADIFRSSQFAISPYVFTQPHGRAKGKPYNHNMLQVIWREAQAATGMTIRLYNACRHSLGCQMLQHGVNLDIVRDQLGHQTSEMTRRYAKGAISVRSDAVRNVRGNVVEFKREAK